MRALVSVSDKTGIVGFCRELSAHGIEIISTGGTYKKLKEAAVPVLEVAAVTGFPECLDGRVKTLHPSIHAGILARRDDETHMERLLELSIATIDFVIVNLYPFKKTIMKAGVTLAEAVENIDIGGPTMLRAAAKNYQDVTVITDPADYGIVIEELRQNDGVSAATKFRLMKKVFVHTAHYDALIADYFGKQQGTDETVDSSADVSAFAPTMTFTYEKVADMRYGENPHQEAAFYREPGHHPGSLVEAKQLHGKELSFNNINDTNGALMLLKEFTAPAVVACKHGNPCGVGTADDITTAWQKASEADMVSIFGGIVVCNREVTAVMATAMNDIFLEVVVAPSYEEEALAILCRKKNIRLLELKDIALPQTTTAFDIKKVDGGMIIQTADASLYNETDWQVVTKTVPSKEQMDDMVFGMKVVKHVKSNGIVLVKDGQTLGIGPGQVNRIWAAKQCFEHADELLGTGVTKGAVLASDAFFPFADVVEAAHQGGVQAIIQPGGSMNDQLSIDKCDEYEIAMVFTGMRHFKH
ncbi:MAG: bifunctional phosphoribosylaminoimidazolecarboxamide formyltransferase/IMP cyclohydrolase [Lachnospiraceae bacterium]|jgi:phosphoribosylaminoimidazolecarboxamide formyltransferase/IMP cyclohydrolase|nr:bifunctional phosphoribosylaminoimidazolecarboxamide formyltransferase/IMP cyclohydrolase [Lachnospiraceae bacterium]